MRQTLHLFKLYIDDFHTINRDTSMHRLYTSTTSFKRICCTNIPRRISTTICTASSLPRLYLTERPLDTLKEGSFVKLSDEESRHTLSLRLKEGDCIEIADGRGNLATAELIDVTNRRRSARLTSPPRHIALPHWKWELYVACGSLKGGRGDWLVEKASELGAHMFVPLLTARSSVLGSTGKKNKQQTMKKKKKKKKKMPLIDKNSDDDDDDDDDDDSSNCIDGTSTPVVPEEGTRGREERWARLSMAAAKQCLRAHTMVVAPPCSISQLCQNIQKQEQNQQGKEGTIALVGVANAPSIYTVLSEAIQDTDDNNSGNTAPPQSSSSKTGILIIGPEGDFTDQELMDLKEAGAQPVGLGPLRLRAETASLAILSVAQLYTSP
jgi:16S rRNA (uracil1498-N3)-methyltransferase